MATRTASARIPVPSGDVSASCGGRWLLVGAPAVALLAGLAAEWLDFRALRVPLLLMVGSGVLATAWRLAAGRTGWRAAAVALAVGVATWAGAEAAYAVIHVARGERFHAEAFGPQWSQAVGLVAAHGLFLGAPTGAVAALLLIVARRWRGRAG